MIIDERMTTTVVDEAEEAVGRVYRRGRFVENGSPFLFAQSVAGDDRAVLAQYTIESQAAIVVDIDSVVGIGEVHRGDYRASSNHDEVDADVPFVLRPGDARSWSSGLDLTMVNLDLRALARHRGSDVTAARLQRMATGPRSPLHATHWQRTVSHVALVFGDRELLTNDLIRESAVDTLLVTALATFDFDDREHDDETDATVSRPVARALRFIEDNAATAIDSVDIAAAARMSVRGLQSAFRRERQTTPMRYLRDTRLERVRAELLLAAPGDAGVSEIARRWGFAHLGRFAQVYRERFGEFPRATLLR